MKCMPRLIKRHTLDTY